MTKLLVNFTRKIVYLSWLQNSGYIYLGIIIPVNVTGKHSKSSFRIRRWQRYCLNNLVHFCFSLYMQASAFWLSRGNSQHATFSLKSGKSVVGAAPQESKCRGLYTCWYRFPVSYVRCLEQEESKYYCHRKVKHKNGWSKRKTNLLQR